MAEFTRKVHLPVSAERAFVWHERPGAFARLTPPWETVRLLEAKGGIRDGALVRVRVNAFGPFGFEAVYRHVEYAEGRRFVDLQEKGPFRKWRHEHRFHRTGEDSCILEDHIEYEAPPLAAGVVAKRLDRMFRYRHAVTFADLMHEATVGPAKPRTVLVSGATGLVGRALCARLTTRGHTVRTLSRRRGDVSWDLDKGTIDSNAMDGVDAVVHLAGEPVAQRWTPAAKERILQSRVKSTQLLVDAMLKARGTRAFISASGINFYGYARKRPVDEGSAPGSGFLAGVCHEWESAARPLDSRDIRAVFIRTGIVLSPAGGALAKMLPAFRLGLGGPIASGRQRMSWIGLEDLVEIYLRAIEDPACRGPVNAVAPEAIDNRTFTKTLGSVLRRPAILPLPAFAVKALFGEMGRETLLSDLAVVPEALRSLSQAWRHAGLESALRHCLGRPLPAEPETFDRMGT